MELDEEVKNVLDEEVGGVSQWWRQLKMAIDIKVIEDTSLLVGNDTIPTLALIFLVYSVSWLLEFRRRSVIKQNIVKSWNRFTLEVGISNSPDPSIRRKVLLEEDLTNKNDMRFCRKIVLSREKDKTCNKR